MSSYNVDLFYETIFNLTKSAGQIIKKNNADRNKLIKIKTFAQDVVTETDTEVENLLKNTLSSKFPDHKFIAEETESTNILTDAPTWIIDPVDGTMNFVHGFPHSCVSVALYINKIPEIGIVYNPVLEQFFTARRGQGAFLNGERIKVSDTKCVSKALIMLEIAGIYPTNKLHTEFLETSWWLLKESHSLRSLGSAALDMCMVACGAADVYYQYQINSWDYAAAELIIIEAGGIVTNTNGKPLERLGRNILAACSKELIDEISGRLAETEAKAFGN